jgi:hypothetical protein
MAFWTWSGDNRDKFPMQISTNLGGTLEWEEKAFRHFQIMSNELSTPRVLACPADTREAATNFTDFGNQNVSYFIDLAASLTNTQGWLSGDRNITNGLPRNRGIMTLATSQLAEWTSEMHNRRGNIALSRSGLWQMSNRELQETMRKSGSWTNRLALPE